MKNTRTQRSSQELILAAQTQLQNRILRAARKDAMSDPAHEETIKAMDEVKVAIREAKKILGDGPQSAAVRISKHQNWINKISREAISAEETLGSSETELTLLEAQLTSAVQNTLEASD